MSDGLTSAFVEEVHPVGKLSFPSLHLINLTKLILPTPIHRQHFTSLINLKRCPDHSPHFSRIPHDITNMLLNQIGRRVTRRHGKGGGIRVGITKVFKSRNGVFSRRVQIFRVQLKHDEIDLAIPFGVITKHFKLFRDDFLPSATASFDVTGQWTFEKVTNLFLATDGRCHISIGELETNTNTHVDTFHSRNLGPEPELVLLPRRRF
mmetsp:Transcript_26505/g.56933  ORF Transcript_26505/g.56933 Transcript_26505/m.56933 type:complete len:207 (+) Transcript_26505:8755-9375(+)